MCEEARSLQISHAIPNSYFRKIKRRNSGKLIKVSEDNSDTQYSQDDGSGILLCGECESYLNSEFDLWGQRRLQEISDRLDENSCRRVFQIDAEKLSGFILSILWRAVKLDTEFYKNSQLDDQTLDRVRGVIFDKIASPSSLAGVKINRIVDDVRHMKPSDFKDLILPPITYSVSIGPTTGVGFLTVFGGFAFTVLFLNRKAFLRSDRGYIMCGKGVVVKDLDFRKHPVLDHLSMNLVAKEYDGRSRIK